MGRNRIRDQLPNSQ